MCGLKSNVTGPRSYLGFALAIKSCKTNANVPRDASSALNVT